MSWSFIYNYNQIFVFGLDDGDPEMGRLLLLRPFIDSIIFQGQYLKETPALFIFSTSIKQMNNIFLTLFWLIMSCSAKSKTEVRPSGSYSDSNNILIVYLSRTKNTKAVAEIIHRNVGGKLVELELQNPYPANYQATVAQVVRENETGYLPRLKTKIDSIGKYNIVFLGFPTWGMQLPPPIKSFLTVYNLGGKTVIPFNTNAGYGIGSSFQTVKELCRNSIIPEGFTVTGGIERDGIMLTVQGDKASQVENDVKDWLRRIKILK